MENTIGEMLLITVSYELLPKTPSLLNHVQFNWKKWADERFFLWAKTGCLFFNPSEILKNFLL